MNTPFSKAILVSEDRGRWKIELNIPYFPSLLTCNRTYYTEADARLDALHLESKLNRLWRSWQGRQPPEPPKGAKKQ